MGSPTFHSNDGEFKPLDLNASRTGNSPIVYFELLDLFAATRSPHSSHRQDEFRG